jgi:hypothetical protein
MTRTANRVLKMPGRVPTAGSAESAAESRDSALPLKAARQRPVYGQGRAAGLPATSTPCLVLTAGLLAAACTERITAPGQCPDFCPDRPTVRDTILRTALGRDTAFRDYWRPHEVSAFRGELLVADLPTVRSRALVRTGALLPPTHRFPGSDTTPYPIIVDSLRLRIAILRRDTAAHNLRLHLYRIPKDVDSLTTFDAVTPAFTDSLVRRVNVDSLIALPGRRDPATRDSVIVNDTTKVTTLLLMLDSARARYEPADSGRLALGLAVTTDSLASIVLGAGLTATWYARVDSAGVVDTIRLPPVNAGTVFATFVFDPPPAPLDSTLAVGGVPAARSLLRVALPPRIRDSTQIIRATLVLVPDRPAQGVPSDSFLVAARRVASDLGAKSVLGVNPDNRPDSSDVALAWVRIGSTDTVRMEVTRIVRRWAADTMVPAAFVLQQSTVPNFIVEGDTFAEIRFKPSSDAAFRPALHVTYMPRLRFEVP